MKIDSTVFPGKNAFFIKKISTKSIIDRYQIELGIDVKTFFKRLEFIELYECEISGYRFFSPFYINGDGEFYSKLQKFKWYYDPWKWEHEFASKHIEETNRVLEIGCGEGSFLEGISKKNTHCIGLELNNEAVTVGKAKNIGIRRKYAADLKSDYLESFDVICSFQVLEHISNVHDFISDALILLAPKGKLILSVPNNDSIIIKHFGGILNLPPHHMGLWNQSSFRKLADIFKLKVVDFGCEPLKSAHHQEYKLGLFYEKFSFVNKAVLNLIYRSLPKVITNKFMASDHKVLGHTMIIVLQKL